MSGHKLLIGALVVFLLFGAGMAPAAESKPAISSGGGKPDAANKPKIENVTGALRHGKSINVKLTGHEEFLKKKDLEKFVLFVDGIKIVTGARLDCKDTLAFDIDNKNVPKEAWGKIARCVAAKGEIFELEACVEVGYGQEPRLAGGEKSTLLYIENWELWLFLLIYAALLAAFFYSVAVTAILRDPSQKIQNVRKRTFSLGKSQMAFWFIIVLPCFFFIWLITGSVESLTKQTLILLGISGLTTLVSGYVGKNKEDKKDAERPKLEQKKGELEGQLIAIKTALDTASPEQTAILRGQERAAKEQLDQINSVLSPENPLETSRNEKEGKQAPEETQGFIKDILRDSYGVNLHRLQCAVWTLVLGYIFISNTICGLTMPEFSATLLALLGISNGTYLALKVPEK